MDIASLLVASVLGALIGFERDVHGHPAGIRTHLLVALGSALFTVISVGGFDEYAGSDPARVAAQVVAGIGFLGAGAILKDGPSIRGLTTAASLWATAAVGMAAGVGHYALASVSAFVVVLSLWPLNAVMRRASNLGLRRHHLHVELDRLDALAEVSRLLTLHRHEIVGVRTDRLGKGRYSADFEVRGARRHSAEQIVRLLGSVDGVAHVEAAELVA